jgi:thiol-disulfide isomerase/thioredoxin
MTLRDFLSDVDGVRAPALDGATGWLNSAPLTPSDLDGHVVAYDFWTYTCVNWLRTLPYRRAWYERYRDHGLIVVGIHTPEFGFEHKLDYVTDAVREYRIDYPVAVDNDYAIWQAFDNHYWPALYLADADGRIRHHRFGEEGYDEIERVIKQLLGELGDRDLPRGEVEVEAEGTEVAADWGHLASLETYLGYARAQRFVPFHADGAGSSEPFAVPPRLDLNDWALAGRWTIRPEEAHLDDGEGTIAYRFRGRDVNLVMGASGGGTRFRVRIDGEPPGAAHGEDCDERGDGVVSTPRLYQLIRQPGRIDDHTFEITFAGAGVGAYAFTFG